MTTSSRARALYSRLEDRLRALVKELAKFGTVGALSFAVDILVFNAMLAATDDPFLSKVVSTVLAATNAFVLNRQWTFKHRERSSLRREYVLFFVLNAIGLGIALSCLYVSRNVLDLQGPLADNIAANGVGLVLGTTFRFLTYRKFIWTKKVEVETAAELDLAATAAEAVDRPTRQPTPDRG